MDLFKQMTVTGKGWGSVPVARLLVAVVLMMIIIAVLRAVRLVWVDRLSRRLEGKRGTLHSTSLIVNYVLGFFAVGMVFHALDINLSTFTILLGALSVGIGFGLQSIVGNFVSGIVILLERPIKIDDRVTVDGVEGNIVDIGIRATTLRTNEGISVIIPNSQFITGTVINRSLAGHTTRFKIPVSVAYASDPRTVEQVLLKVALQHPGTLNEPAPYVVFEAFGESALEFFLWVWTREYTHQPMLFRSELNFAIHAALKEAGIEVPFRQVDVRLRQS
jgi:small-conductance mechanosensitive channel